MARNPKLEEYSKNCPKCGKKQLFSSRKNLLNSIKKNAKCLSCKNRVYRYPMYESIPLYWLKLKEESAQVRNYKWELTAEYVWNIYIKQNKVCALSGVPIEFPTVGRKASASIDRIDPTKGYTFENVQLVHKDVNRMKSVYQEDYFIDMCKKIVNKSGG